MKPNRLLGRLTLALATLWVISQSWNTLQAATPPAAAAKNAGKQRKLELDLQRRLGFANRHLSDYRQTYSRTFLVKLRSNISSAVRVAAKLASPKQPEQARLARGLLGSYDWHTAVLSKPWNRTIVDGFTPITPLGPTVPSQIKAALEPLRRLSDNPAFAVLKSKLAGAPQVQRDLSR